MSKIKEINGLVERLHDEVHFEGPVVVLFALADACETMSIQEGIDELTEEEKQTKRNLLRVSVLIRDLSDLILMYEDQTEEEYNILKEFLQLKKGVAQ
jgi:hypothetical protein